VAYLDDNRSTSSTRLVYPRVKRRWGPGLWELPGVASLTIAVFCLAAWELAVRGHILSAFYFPSPSFIAETFWKLAREGVLWQHTRATLWRLVAGFSMGVIPGLCLGLLMGWSRHVRDTIDPLIAALHPLPKIALLPLIMVIFGVGDTSLAIVAAAGAFFPMLINTMAGVQQINPIYFQVARNYRASRLKLFQRVVLPGSLPNILTGLRLAANTTLLLAVAAEMVGARHGLGGMIWLAWNTMRTEEIYVCLLTITLLGVLFNALLRWLDICLTPWHEKGSG
jgi:ABC-type nitrate/sulfonate/bicarbonate transport system permease component